MAYPSDGPEELSLLAIEELVRQLGRSSPEEASPYCEEVIRRFEPLLRRVWRSARFQIEYQDFVQEVFVRLFSGLPYLENPKAFPGYFRRVALSVVMDLYRRSATRPVALPLSADEVADREIVDRVDEVIRSNLVIWSYLEKLEGREKEILTLEFVQQKDISEIAHLLGITPGGVRTTRARALKHLREILLAEAAALEK